jgi:hypothetical protein
MMRYNGPPATLGSSLRAGVRLIVTCRGCGHQAEPDLADLVDRHGADTAITGLRARLVCSRCGVRESDLVISGTKREDGSGIGTPTGGGSQRSAV